MAEINGGDPNHILTGMILQVGEGEAIANKHGESKGSHYAKSREIRRKH